MSSLEKRHTGQRGSMQGHHKYSDGFSDTSSSGSFMDDTDREVSNLTDRAFRSLCIGEEAIYNDSEFSSSPTERHKAFGEVTQQRKVSQETFSYSIQQYGETEAQPEMAPTFQHSYVDVTHQEQAFKEGSLSYLNNGTREVMWQQGRSSSRVSSLIKAFSSGECYRESGTCDVILARDRYKDFGSESWDKSALLSMQRELSELSSGYHQNFKSGPFQSYRNHFYTSDMATAVSQMDTTVVTKTSKSHFKALNSTNFFFHSEFSPFQLWEDYNRFPLESSNVSGFMSASEFPRWYDSPMYKELKDNHRIPNSVCESRRFNQKQIQDVVYSQRSTSMKASAIKKRCESEMASNCPPWKKNNNFVRNKLPCNRPSTVSPTNERTCRPDSNLFHNNTVTHEIVVESTLPSSVTPFNITQLLTPVIHTRQETETSEILQFAHTPSVSDYSSQGETDPKLQTEVKHLRDSYKSKASSLLFNLKDNRKRVKSTYSPTRFKGLEITDRNKQPSKLEGRESRFSDILVSQEMTQENLTGTDTWASSNLIREPSAPNITLKDYTDGFGSYDNLTLTSPQNQDGIANYKSFHGNSEGHSPNTDPLANIGLSTHNLSAQDKKSLTSEGELKDFHGTFSPARPEIANMHPKAYPPTNLLPAQTPEQYGQSDNVSQNDLKQRKDLGRKTFIEYSQNEAVKERCPWDQVGSVKETDSRSESRPFRGEIAALIELDKQRKATAKQYSANDSYSVRKETYMQKVNEDIKLGRLSKEEEKEVREDTVSPKKTSNSDKSPYNKKLNMFSKHTESYEIPNSLQNKTSSLKEAYGGLQNFNAKNELVKEVPLKDHKDQKNEGLYSYQPYKYEPNKQWHMPSTSEDRHTKESIWTHKQSEIMEQTSARSYKISNTSSQLHNIQNEFSTSNSAANLGLQGKQLLVSADTSDQNNTTKQEDRFSINDILAIRDHEQARRLKDNTFVLAKSENSQNQIKYDTTDKRTATESVKEQEQQSYKVHDVSPSPGNIRKDFYHTNETNISNDRKSRIMSKDADKVTTRVLSYKERGQSKQEILTSKLKAHAQKEISAIKEKGLTKQGILARNATKASVTLNNDAQEGNYVKKEITADKLNHLFQDITYSSVTQYKEQHKTHNNHPKNGSPPMEKQSLNFEDNQNEVFEKKVENVKYIPLTMERQNKKHAGEYKELMTETLLKGGAVVPDNVQKNDQPSRISEDKQLSSKEMNYSKELAKQRHEVSPRELLDQATIKAENYNSHNPPALHNEKQTIQHDQKEHVYKSNLSHYTNSEKPADTSKKDLLHVTSTETETTETKSNSGIKKNSVLELERNTPRSEEVIIYNKSKIAAAMEQSKNEPIKNSSEITSSQLTSSSSDMKFKNGIPPAKRLMEPAKSELTSNLQTNTLSADAEQLINRAYKNKSGFTSDSEASSKVITGRVNPIPTNNSSSQKPKEPETLQEVNAENGQALIMKNTTKENCFTKQENNTSQVKVKETIIGNQMVESQSKQTNEKSLTKESSQLKELHQDNKNTKTFDKISLELPRNTNKIKDDPKAANNSQQGDKRTESASPKQKEQEFPRLLEISHEKNNHKSTTGSQEVSQSNPEPQKTNENDIKPNVPSQHKVVDKGATQNNNTKPVLTQNAESTAEVSNMTIVSSSKETPAEEPMIYSICVSKKSEVASDDEPIIYSICVSSTSHIDEEQNPVKQDENSVETEMCVKDESFSTKNDRAENKPNDFHRKIEGSSNIEEIEDKTGKLEPPSTLDKSNAIERITTSYEDLLVKYGLPVRDHSHLASKHLQEERKRKEEEAESQLAQKTPKHGIESPQEAKVKNSENKQSCVDDSRQVSVQASITSQVLKDNESEIKQVKVQHHDVSCSKNMAEKQHGIKSPQDAIEKNSENKQTCVDDSRQVSYQQASITSQHLKKSESKIKPVNVQHYGTPCSKNVVEKQHGIKSPQEAKMKRSENKQTCVDDSREASYGQASITSQLLKENESKIKQVKVQQCDASWSKNMDEKQHGIKSPQEVKVKNSENKQSCLNDSRQASDQQASITSQALKETESKVKQLKVQHYDASRSKKESEKQQSTGNNAGLHNIEPSNQNGRNGVLKKVEEQVRNNEKVQSMRMTGNINNNISNSRKSPEKTSPTTKQSAMGESFNSNASMSKDSVNKKLYENKIPRRTTTPQIEKKPEQVKSEDKSNCTDTFTHQNEMHGSETFNSKVKKTTYEGKQEDCIMAQKTQPASDKNAQTLQKNGKGDLGDKRGKELQELQVESKKSHEIANRIKMGSKDGGSTHVNNYKDKVSSIGEDVCTVVKQDQASFKDPRIHLEDIKVSTEKVSSTEEFMVGHKNQHEVIKRENQKEKKAVVTEHVGEKDITMQKNLPVQTLTAENEPKTVDTMNGTCELGSKHACNAGIEITPLKKDGSSESVTEINPRQGAVKPQEMKVYENKQPTLNSDKIKKEDFVLSLSEQNNGDLKVNESRSSHRGKNERHVEATETKQADRTNTNQYQPDRSFVPETKINASHEEQHAPISQQETKKEGILSKPEATQRNKVTRPEISAIADYARLRVIAAEDDTKDLDIFFYNSNDQSSLRIHKDLHGHVSDTGEKSKREAISREKRQNLKQATSPFKKQMDKETLPQKHNPSTSTAEPKPLSSATSDTQGRAAPNASQLRTNQKESNNKQTLMEHPNRRESNKMYQSKDPQGAHLVPLQAESSTSRSKQLTNDNMTEKARLSHSGRQESLASSATIKPADQINIASAPGEEMEELQYYTVNALDVELKPNKTPEPPLPSVKMSPNKDSAEKSEEEKKEESLFLQSLMDYGKGNATGPRSNSSSPAMGKPNMFKVKDNTMRASSVTKTVKPRFHRSLSDDLRVGSPKEHFSGSEKEDENHPRDSANTPVLHEPAIAAARLHKLKETLNNLSSTEYTTKQSNSHRRRSQNFEEEETHSVISTTSEDMEKCTGVSNINLAFMPKNENYRDTYQRPASACYERPDSVCYERPESACSDIRSLGKPPAVPPKSEKALRRAQRLTTRRMKKAETPKTAPENQEQMESKSITNVSDVPSSPSEELSTQTPVQASPPHSQYDIQPNYSPPAHSMVAQPFPMTQRKLLQDPNSGQYFMVDVPLPVKTKTFYDPETGKYVQLNVRQRSQDALTQPASVEMLNAPYMLYRGFLPMAASSLPTVRSSETSTLAGLTVDHNTLETGSEQWRQNVHLQNHSRDSQQYRSNEEIHSPALYAENSVNSDGRQTDIITMSELEDFAMEST